MYVQQKAAGFLTMLLKLSTLKPVSVTSMMYTVQAYDHIENSNQRELWV